MARGSEDWRGGGVMFTPATTPAPAAHTFAVPSPSTGPLMGSYISNSAAVAMSISRRNRNPGPAPTPSNSRHYTERDNNNSRRRSPSPRRFDSPSPPLSSAGARQRSHSTFDRSLSTSASSEDDDPILPHTHAYNQALAARTGGANHNHSFTSFPSFISNQADSPSQPPSPSRRPLPRSHSQPVRAALYTSHTHSSRSRPSSPSKSQKSRAPSRTPTPPHVQTARATSQSTSSRGARHAPTSSAASAQRSRPTTPSNSTFSSSTPSQPPGGRTRIPQRPRAYSASAAEALETLAETPPPLPPLPLPHNHRLNNSLDASHARALESALNGITHVPHNNSSRNPYTPRQAFPTQPATPPSPYDTVSMSVTSHTRAPEAPHRLPSSASGIPVLKARTRSSPRSPSPDFPDSAERLADELPPFRVDLDAALAEIEDELEVRAHERYALAHPAPRTPNSATFAQTSMAATPTSSVGSISGSVGSVSKIRPPKQRTRPSLPVTANGSANSTPTGGRRASVSAASNATKRAGVSPNATPKASKAGLGRAASYSVSPEGATRSKSMPRRRHGSDTTQTLTHGARNPRAAPALSTPPAGRRGSATTRTRTTSATNATASTPPMQSQSKLGVAAHFVPPENTFTPPKGADWDDVVLPTVARKTGITVASSHGHGASGHGYSTSHSYSNALSSGEDDVDAEDDLLAVEWDKEGTPIRWERQRRERDVRAGLSEDDFAANRAAAEALRERDEYGCDDFGAPTTPAHASKRQSLKEAIEMAPLRSSAAPATDLEGQSGLGGQGVQDAVGHGQDQARPPRPDRAPQRGTGEQPPSQPQQQAQYQAQAQTQAQANQGGHMSLPRPMEVAPPSGLMDAKGGKRKKRDDDEVKAGCACVIM